ncbi:MAG TPA: carbon-nitrogen hydrolase family protein [Deltaproteobacteria bacterium]|nr:carbon-nitrogen hydrolase family protein [Deltaproteobacteria bacterium]HOI08481.1 carbon-nitrogen hydrolase family protein [Deltaproteobacteria bacterium]
MESPIKAGAVQMEARVGDIAGNLEKAERLLDEAASKGARLIILPEFFPSAAAFDPSLLGAALEMNGKASALLASKARQHQAYVGGSFIASREGRRFNTFVLAMPDGGTATHDKDLPTMWENCYYEPGSDDGVLDTPLGHMGAVLCWEFIRNRTVHRLLGRVDCVVGGSCWWTVPMNWPPAVFWQWLHRRNERLMAAAPSTLARILGVAVVHAAHAGSFTADMPLMPGVPYSSFFLGETQIVDRSGAIAARMRREDGEGVITADITLGRAAPSMACTAAFWIPRLPVLFRIVWTYQNIHGRRYYTRAMRGGRLNIP